MSALRLTPGRQVPMASPPPMGVLGVIMGNVVPGGAAPPATTLLIQMRKIQVDGYCLHHIDGKKENGPSQKM